MGAAARSAAPRYARAVEIQQIRLDRRIRYRAAIISLQPNLYTPPTPVYRLARGVEFFPLPLHDKVW